MANPSGSTVEDSGYYSALDHIRPWRQRRVHENPAGSRTSSIAAPTQSTATELTNAAEQGSSSSVNNRPVERRRSGPPLEMERNAVQENTEGSVPRRRRSTFSRRPMRREPETRRTLFSWLISKGVVHVNQKVWYLDVKKEVLLLEGSIKQGGILCNCCNEELTPWQFEAHATNGYEFPFRQPYSHIFLPRNQHPLLNCMVMAWFQPEEVARQNPHVFRPLANATDRSDDACIICADGGDLICCERCPSTFHPTCMGMDKLPQGEWLCPFCVCKYCGNVEGKVLKCAHCAKKYHWDCFMTMQGLDLNCTDNFSFCGSDCREVYETLQAMLGVNNEVGGGISWTLLQRKEVFQRREQDDYIHRMEVNCKIAVAWTVLNEIFLTNIDRHTRINMLESVVYNRGSNLTRVNFDNFYVAVLEKKGEVITAATIRVHGRSMVEMPFIATREGYRKQGMSRILLNCIESTLSSLKIPILVIPSMPELVHLWTHKYTFSPIKDGLMVQLRKLNLLMFPSSVRLQKPLLPNRAIEREGSASGRVLLDLNLDPPEEMEE